MGVKNIFSADKTEKLKDGRVIFTPSQVQLLSRINRDYRKKGESFSLTDQKSIDSMIIKALKSDDESIKENVSKLMDTLPEAIKKDYEKVLKINIDKIKNSV